MRKYGLRRDDLTIYARDMKMMVVLDERFCGSMMMVGEL